MAGMRSPRSGPPVSRSWRSLFWFFTDDDPVLVARRARGEKPRSAWLELEPLKNIQVWRFALYYFFVFGAFVALSLWLPQYLINVYNVDIKTAGMIAAAFSFPASIFRAYGGHLSDRYGARTVMYWTFLVAVACTFVLSYPPSDYIVRTIYGPRTFHLEMGVVSFTVIVFVLGFFMALGKAAVYKHIPVYYPKNVGAVGGLVGMIGGLGGFVLPIAFGALNDLTGLWTSCFMLLFALVSCRLGLDARLDPSDGARRGWPGACEIAAAAGIPGNPQARSRRCIVGSGAHRLAA